MVNTNNEASTVESGINDSAHASGDERKTYWAQQVQAWQQSGLTQAAFCRQEDLVHHRFIYWRGKFQTKSPSSRQKMKATRHAFVPVTLTDRTEVPLQIALPNGIVVSGIRGDNIDVVRQLIQSL